jgi:hypothetical protein
MVLIDAVGELGEQGGTVTFMSLTDGHPQFQTSVANGQNSR